MCWIVVRARFYGLKPDAAATNRNWSQPSGAVCDAGRVFYVFVVTSVEELGDSIGKKPQLVLQAASSALVEYNRARCSVGAQWLPHSSIRG
jgi:hypothetical protein